MATMTMTEPTLQQGLNEVVMNKVQRMIDGKSVGVQATMERLIHEGKIAQDYVAPLGVELKKKQHEPVITFNGEQGLKTIRPLENGEKLMMFKAGCYGTKDGVKRLVAFYKDMRERIANECQPYEIYCYEYNNHESFISWDGDMGAIMIIVEIFGVETAKKIQRFSPVYSIDELLKDDRL